MIRDVLSGIDQSAIQDFFRDFFQIVLTLDLQLQARPGVCNIILEPREHSPGAGGDQARSSFHALQ